MQSHPTPYTSKTSPHHHHLHSGGIFEIDLPLEKKSIRNPCPENTQLPPYMVKIVEYIEKSIIYSAAVTSYIQLLKRSKNSEVSKKKKERKIVDFKKCRQQNEVFRDVTRDVLILMPEVDRSFHCIQQYLYRTIETQPHPRGIYLDFFFWTKTKN